MVEALKAVVYGILGVREGVDGGDNRVRGGGGL